MPDAARTDEVVIPALLRAARNAYGQAIRTRLALTGFDDMPRNGPFVLGGMANRGGSAGDLIQHLGVSKQAASQLIDTLVLRGYMQRQVNPEDRRRMAIELTDRGRAAAAAVRAGVEAVDVQLAELLSPADLAGMRVGLLALAEIAARDEGGSVSSPTRPTPNRPAPTRLNQLSPIFPVRDLQRALAHYEALGFDTKAYAEADEYGFADRDGVGLHFSVQPDLDPEVGAGAAYLYVEDADALAAEWSRPGIGGTTRPVQDTEYGLREGSHLDPDHNLIRFGSPIRHR